MENRHQQLSVSRMTRKEKALASFRQQPLCLNCAQAVAHAFDREDLVSVLRTAGGGNAPDGLCGALHAALQICGKEAAPKIAEAFEKKLGYRRCLNLKKDARIPCPACVATATELLETLEA
ncbi:MAG: hypothetical protein IKM45_01730 [Opitutales bacterium]|nr:hypothetical protein [Opitutales bacterium]